MNNIIIGEEIMQSAAKECCDRKLTDSQLEMVCALIHEDLFFMVVEKVRDVVEDLERKPSKRRYGN